MAIAAGISATTTSASPSSAGRRSASPAGSSGPTSSIATIGRLHWCRYILKSTFRHDPVFYGIKTLLTIHNLGYQGRFGAAVLRDIAIPAQDVMHPEGIEYFGDVNYLKGGIVYSDYITTVSPTYAQEIQTPEFGFGLDPLLRARRFFIAGILNGVDYEEWNL